MHVGSLYRHGRTQRGTLRGDQVFTMRVDPPRMLDNQSAARASCEVKPFSRSINSGLLSVAAAAECFCLGAAGRVEG